MKPEVSIIVPVYNTVKYLEDCVNSILTQSFRDFELLLVDDGSTDGSGDICDHYLSKDSRIFVTHISNSGVTTARKIGLDKSNADWILFVDSDDTIPEDALNSLWEGHLAYDTDFVVGYMNDIRYSPPSLMSLDKWREICVSGDVFLPGPVARLIKKNLFDDDVLAIPRSIVKGEDMLMNIRLSFNMTRDPVIVHKKVYEYRKNPDSCVHTFITDADYEETFHQLCINAIPIEYIDSLMSATIHHRLLKLNELYELAPFDNEWRSSTFINHLLRDIREVSFPVPFKSKVEMLHLPNILQKSLGLLLRFDSWQYDAKCRIKVVAKRFINHFHEQ